MKLNALEKAILDFVAERNPDAALKAQIAAAEVIRRNYTGAGMYVYLFHPQNDESLKIKFPENPYSGPVSINSPKLEFGAGSFIWCDDGFVSCMEIYSYSNDYPEDQFTISDK